jgi:hypothetical protein
MLYDLRTGVLLSMFVWMVLLPSGLSAQRKWKDYWITGSSCLLSGMIDGTIETINYHYDYGFKPRFPKANAQFWDPSLSWANKYKNGCPAQGPKFTGSTDVFVWTTDAYHLLRTANRAVECGTLVYYVNKNCSGTPLTGKKKWKAMATDFVVLTVIRSIGFNITYALLFKQEKSWMNI